MQMYHIFYAEITIFFHMFIFAPEVHVFHYVIRAFSYKFYCVRTNASFASIPLAHCSFCGPFFYVQSHACISVHACRPDRRRHDKDFGRRTRQKMQRARAWPRGCDISCLYTPKLQNHRWQRRDKSRYCPPDTLPSAPCRLLIARGRMDRNRLGL